MRRIPLARAVLALLALAACDRAGNPVQPSPERPPAPLASLSCRAEVRAGTLRCGPADGLAPGARGLVVGGQGRYVQLDGTSAAYDAGTGIYTVDVTVGNLIPQALGTLDGTAGDGKGVYVFFHAGPDATSGGTVSVVADTVGTSTATGQPYYRYAAELGGDGMLSQNETSAARTWTFQVPASVPSFTFQVFVAANVAFPSGYVDVTPPSDTMAAGGSQALAATVRTAVGDGVAGASVTWTTSDSAVAVVSDSGVVSGVGPGTATITATSGARTGAATVSVCPSLAVGASFVADSGSFCLAGGASGAEYTVVPVATGTSDVAFSITGSGIVPVAGSPSPDVLPAMRGPASSRAPVADVARHVRRMERERRMLAGLAPRLVAPSAPRRAISPGVPSVGMLMSINVADGCSTPSIRTGRVTAVESHVVVIADTTNPSGGLTSADYGRIALLYDSLVHPAVTGAFGTPTDIDGNGRVVAFFTGAINDLTPPGATSVVGSAFRSRDLVSTSSCPTSNQGEVIYLLAADPSGVRGNVRTAAFVKERAERLLAHELQHLVNASRRLYAAGGPFPLEQTWLDEGLSGIAEELLFHQATGLAPGRDLDAADVLGADAQDEFLRHAHENLRRLREWLLRPDTTGPVRPSSSDAAAGAAWSFLRYAADRRGGSQPAFWAAFAASADTGTTNLRNRIGADPGPWVRDWAAGLYADDAGLASVASRHAHPSWDLRSVFGALDFGADAGCDCAYPLRVEPAANGVALPLTLAAGGGTAYVRVGVPVGAFAGISTTAPGGGLAVTVLRRR